MRNTNIHSALWAFIMAASLFTLEAHADSLTGVLQKKDGAFFLTLSTTNELYALTNISAEASASLIRMESGDYINGSGDIDEKNHKISLQTLDYVGLKKLLGVWYSGDSVMNFSSFNDLSVYPFGFDLRSSRTPPSTVISKTDFRYSTAPYYGDRWALFLSDSARTTFATLEISADTAILRTFSPENGAVLRTLRLVRATH